ncbi:MAG: NAD(P)/FAD-dependent oxidoreductase [Candidatus Bathyarchaeota archaeon]|nr:NAD(P)/FAD-dependent oxidoreductase [Candidatus Bathyarchaeota archaeon]MDH5788526.1 NAD(P)/FAD-dependent oxidoreductase [Candidatus Bathyarchaeota archaeon]
MQSFSDVVVVGGGPCGSFAALNLGKFGVKVTVFEEHDEIGVPSHCTGHISIKGLKHLGLYPLPSQIVENTFYGANFYSPKGGKFSIRFSSPVTCVVNRVLFDKYIAKIAETFGVRYHLSSRVESLFIENGFVKGVNANQNGKDTEKFLSKMVIDAEGTSSKILRQTGLTTFDSLMLVNGVQAEVENVEDAESDMVDVFLGRDYAPGFYAWLVPKSGGKAKVGLAAKKGNPKELLRRFMFKHPVASRKLHNARILQTEFHPLPLGGSILKLYSNGFLAVGDVASQVKPTTGGGVILGMICAKVASEVARVALCANDFSSELLGTYQKRCEEILGFDLTVMLAVRRMLSAMSDKKIDDVIGFCAKFGLGETLQNFRDIDFQGQAILKTLRSPKMLITIIYFFFLYLSANI